MVLTTLAPRGHTPSLAVPVAHRHSVSVAAALVLSPARQRVGLFWESFAGGPAMDAETYIEVVSDLLGERRGPVVLLQDRAAYHHRAIEELLEGFGSRLAIEEFPPYAPELNPVEFLWRWGKGEEMANLVPADGQELQQALHAMLAKAAADQRRLRSFFHISDLTGRWWRY